MAADALRALRREAVERTFFAPTDLLGAIERLGFVQADPIRAPARAQDLILRHRVVGYRAGDLERAYSSLPLIEDMVHVYGFLPRRHRALLHPRRIARTFHVEHEHPRLRRAILAHLTAAGSSHPRDVELALAARHPRAAVSNAWGGQSNATTRMLDVLQYRGLLHVTGRRGGVRLFGIVEPSAEPVLSREQRADGLIELLVRLYAPLSRATLAQLTLMLGERAMPRGALRARIPRLVQRGVLRMSPIDGVDYVRPGDDEKARPTTEPTVRFVAPFDPLVWDRRRFTHLWGWDYRFEAYTPSARRRFGYYALPILYDTGDDARVVGWITVGRTTAGTVLDVRAGYVNGKPRGRGFADAFDAEVARMTAFMAAEPAA